MSTEGTTDRGRVRIPADVEREDRLLGGLTARQLGLLAVPAIAGWFAYLALQNVVPLALFAAVGCPLAVLAVTVAIGRRDGLPLDRLLLAGWRQRRSPRRLVPAPEGVEAAPAWAGPAHAKVEPAPLRLPMTGVADDGTLGLGSDGAAVVLRASTLNLALRTPAEQRAVVAIFGGFLNSLQAPVQIVVRSEPINLAATVTHLQESAGGLPHPALEVAALAHARFLSELAEDHDLLHRDVLLVLRDPGTDAEAPTRLRRRAAETAAALAGAGITVSPLAGPDAAHVVAASLDPWAADGQRGLAAEHDVIAGGAS